MKGWDVTAEMKIRFDVENNNMILYENPQYETPLGTLKPGDATGRRQGFSYPNIDWKLMKFGSYAVEVCSIIICRLMCPVCIFSNGENILSRQWRDSKWK